MSGQASSTGDGSVRFREIAGRRIAFRHAPAAAPTLVFLPGYQSDMSGSKATALLAWAEARGQACLLLDYSGCGLSDGSFAEGTLGRWRDEVLGLIDGETEGTVVLVGSSMGGWLMLLVALALPAERVAGLVGIAAAPDFTEWGYDAAQKAQLAAGSIVHEANPYGPEPTPTHPDFWADGQERLLLAGTIPFDAPVRLLHGQADRDVPPDLALRLAARLRSADVQVTLIKDGDHRLSRDGDVALLLRTIAPLLTGPAS
jgi:pimeloyl-ACP methyl ester carboxylesterase